MAEQQGQGSHPNIPQDPNNDASSQSNTDVQNTSPPSDDNMVNQPEVTVDEYLTNPTNVQMTDHLLNEHKDKILVALLLKGVKLPPEFDMSQYANTQSPPVS